MRKFNYIILSVLLIVVAPSCDKFLSVNPEYAQDVENFFETKEDYERALIGAYDLLQGSFLTLWIGEVASDNAIAGGESVNDPQGLHQIDEMTHGGVNLELRNVLRYNYAGITRVNYILENKDKIDFVGKNHLLAEARFLRAFYYFELVKFFGDVPLIIDRRIGIEEAVKLPRSPKAEVYAQIESDLLYAIPILNPIASQKGRVTKGAAQAYLGKVYLYQNKFTEAAAIFDEVIASGSYSLIPDYSQLFSVANENNSETVFDIQYTGLEGGWYGCYICAEGNIAAGFAGIRQYNGPVYGDGNSYNLPTQSLYDAFSSIDPRRETTILDIDAFIAAQPNASEISYAVGAGGHTGFYNNKYIKRLDEIGLPDNDLTSPVNYRIMRYADVLLMAAEAHFNIGNTSVAQSLVNQIRTRAGIPGISVVSLNDIYKERRFELSGEGLRFFDLVRTGQAASFIDGFIVGKHELFPIPQIELDLVGGVWEQNPGY